MSDDESFNGPLHEKFQKTTNTRTPNNPDLRHARPLSFSAVRSSASTRTPPVQYVDGQNAHSNPQEVTQPRWYPVRALPLDRAAGDVATTFALTSYKLKLNLFAARSKNVVCLTACMSS